jgi:hypothetical protein
MLKILLAGVVGGIVVFAWSAFSHMVLPTGEAGIRQIPNEDAVMRAMKESIREPGMYLFPGMDMRKKPTPEEQKAWTEKYIAGPTGLLVYHPTGSSPLSPRQLVTECLSNIAAAILLALVLSSVPASLGRRALFGMLLGTFAWLSITVSYWNWYGFPGSYTWGEGLDQIVGWLLGGLTIAAVFKRAKV